MARRDRPNAPPVPPPDQIKILLDTPSSTPGLDAGSTARALAAVIRNSSPQFAVGLFGGWGSGKTTLMRAIRDQLAVPPDPIDAGAQIVVVDFNAWRYEREPLLLVPLLDTIRAAIAAWAAQRDAGMREKLRGATRRIARVVRALVSGLSGEVAIPGAVKVGYDVGKAVEMLAAGDDGSQPQSLYLAAFEELSGAFEELMDNGVDRVVVFVDDLDRCLPSSALEVLESMKLFFDLPGFVFVVGLDDDVVERAVAARYATPQAASAPAAGEPAGQARPASATDRLSRDYVKKIFQVPYSVPPVVKGQLDVLLRSMCEEAHLSAAQLNDVTTNVRPYLTFIAEERAVNPREVKRFINNYTLQILVRPDLDPDTILAVQTLKFRYEDELLYSVLLADSGLFVDALRRYRNNEAGALEELHPQMAMLPAELVSFLKSPEAKVLTEPDDLDAYISSVESSTASTIGSWLIDAFRPVGRLRRELVRVNGLERISGPNADQLMTVFRQDEANLMSLGSYDSRPEVGGRLFSLANQLKGLFDIFPRNDVPDTPEIVLDRRARAAEAARVVDELHQELQILRISGR